MQIGVETSKAVDQRRVFVIDADDVTRTVLQFMLQDEIETHEVASLDEAFVKGVDWLKPHLILLGASLLSGNAQGVVAEIFQRFGGVRLVIVADASDDPAVTASLRAGAHGTILKPLTLEAVRRKVDTVLGRTGAAPLVTLPGL
ncbi:response regulator [Acuticoccus sediminis]|uniref:response regulator n=1 Tax=Acuticoccus sediminis TaxID=2184697 RepID=UPI001CFE9DB5|nr:response regulator [Acuticoccus sediminis]